MKFGVFLNQYYLAADGFEVTDLFEQVELMESVGFDSATVGERHLHREGVVEPMTALAALAGLTTDIELGTSTILPALYHPLRLAEQVAMIDRIAGGRMVLGTALGYREPELAAFDVAMDERVPAFIESLELVKRFLREGSVSHDGRYWSFDDAFISPRPASEVPVWIGAHADTAIKRAAYRADGWIASASSTAEDLERQIEVYESALAEFGKTRAENDVILMRDCFVADSMAAARETIEPHLLQLYRWYARWGQTYLDEHEVEVDYEELEAKFVIGTPEDCIERLRRYEDLGVDHVLIRCQFPGQSQERTLECLERFGQGVIPAFT